MKNLNPGAENGRKNGAVALGLRPDQIPSTINIKVSHGQNEYEVSVPSNSRFADLKSVMAEKIGLKLDTHKLLFRGKEKEDDEYLETAGLKENSKVLLVEDKTEEQKIHEEVKETSVPSKGGEAVAEVKKEVDKLVEQVSSFQATLDSGKKVDEKNIIYLTEMLMRQLLKLDGIEAEGEGKIQRKMEVRRVQSLVDTVDVLKSRNSNPSSNLDNSAPVTTQSESFGPAHENGNSPSAPSHAPVPSSAPTNPALAPSSSPAPAPAPAYVPSATPMPAPSSLSSHGTFSATPYYTPTSTPSYGPSAHAPYHYDAPVSHPPYHYNAPSSYAHLPYDAPSSYAHSPYDVPSSHAQFSYDTPSCHAQFSYDTPYAPTPYAPTSYAPTHYAPTPYAPSPYAPAPYTPNHYAPSPYAPNPYGSPHHTLDPIPSYDAAAAHSYDSSSTPSHAPPMPSSTKVTRDWERFE